MCRVLSDSLIFHEPLSLENENLHITNHSPFSRRCSTRNCVRCNIGGHCLWLGSLTSVCRRRSISFFLSVSLLEVRILCRVARHILFKWVGLRQYNRVRESLFIGILHRWYGSKLPCGWSLRSYAGTTHCVWKWVTFRKLMI